MFICEALVVICGMPYGVAQNGIIIMQMFLPTLETKKNQFPGQIRNKHGKSVNIDNEDIEQ